MCNDADRSRQVLACKNNPQLAARLLTLLSGWTKLGASRRELMKGQLERIRRAALRPGLLVLVARPRCVRLGDDSRAFGGRDTPGLSTDVLEIATRALSAK